MEEEIKSIYIAKDRLRRLSEEERQALYRHLGELGLLPAREARPPQPIERKRSFLARAYSDDVVAELTDEEVEAAMAALPTAVEKLPPKKQRVLNPRNLRIVERWTEGARYFDIAREEKMGSMSAVGNVILRTARAIGDRIPYEDLKVDK